jgi:phage portal protein BeeE
MRRRQQTKSILGGTFGAKAVTLSDFDNFLDWLVSGGEGSDKPDELYKAVSWFFWCVNRRANAISSMPHLILPLEAEDDDPELEVELGLDLRPMLWQAEAWLCLEGRAYVLKQREGNTLDDLQVLNAYTMRVKGYDHTGPTLFEQKVKGQTKLYRPEELLYFRYWNPRDDIGAGVAPSSPGETPSQVIRHTNSWESSTKGT